ncbi:MAG: DnaJ domain-containing protein [Myxococcota bacterium]
MNTWSVRELIAYLDRLEPILDQITFFDLLEVSRHAQQAGIRQAFHRRASQLHPDLYRFRLSTEDHERLTRVYGRVAEAYLVLRDPETREAYVRDADRDDSAAEGAVQESMLPPKALRLYRRAQAAQRTGDTTSAILNLRLAVASAPGSQLLRDALERALDQT